MSESSYDARSNLETTGFTRAAVAERYNRARPSPPAALLDLIESYVDGPVGLVVDIGSGTGLSTFPWSARLSAYIPCWLTAFRYLWSGATLSPPAI